MFLSFLGLLIPFHVHYHHQIITIIIIMIVSTFIIFYIITILILQALHLQKHPGARPRSVHGSPWPWTFASLTRSENGNDNGRKTSCGKSQSWTMVKHTIHEQFGLCCGLFPLARHYSSAGFPAPHLGCASTAAIALAAGTFRRGMAGPAGLLWYLDGRIGDVQWTREVSWKWGYPKSPWVFQY